jgi:hypothetical protein
MMHTAVGKTAVCHAAHRRPSPTHLTPPPTTTVVAVLCTAISSRCFAMRYNRCLRHATPSTTSFVAVQCHQCQPPTLYFAVSGHHLRVDVQHRRQPLPTTFAAVASTMMSPRCIAMNDHRPSRRCTPPAATAACHHICDAHCHQQQPPSTCNATGDHRRHDTAQRVSSNRRPRVPCVVFGYRRLCDDVHRRQTPAPTPPPPEPSPLRCSFVDNH